MNLNNEIYNSDKNTIKSVAIGAFLETVIESGFSVLTFQNDSDSPKLLEKVIDNSFIQLHFCIKGSTQFSFNNNT